MRRSAVVDASLWLTAAMAAVAAMAAAGLWCSDCGQCLRNVAAFGDFDMKLSRVPSEQVSACLACWSHLSHAGAYLTNGPARGRPARVISEGPASVGPGVRQCMGADARGEPSNCRISFSREYILGVEAWLEQHAPNRFISGKSPSVYMDAAWAGAYLSGNLSHVPGVPDEEHLAEYLCSSVPQRPVTEFMQELKASNAAPAWTGERPGSYGNLTDRTLKRILTRAQIQEAGAELCFILLLTNFVREEPNIERRKVNAFNFYQIANESALETVPAWWEYPAKVIPMRDEDAPALALWFTRSAFDVFVQWENVDRILYLNSTAEYQAIFHHEFAEFMQEPVYMPSWIGEWLGTLPEDEQRQLARKSDGGDVALLEYNEFVGRGSTVRRPLVTDAHSDAAFAARTFWGPAQNYLQRAQLPSDPDYTQARILGVPSFPSPRHRARCDLAPEHKPANDDLIRMGLSFWGGRSDEGALVLERIRQSAVEVDVSFLYHFETRAAFERAGSIAYFDASSMQPMGIWLVAARIMVLPSDDDSRPWTHAKLTFRSNVNQAVAGTEHIAGLHMETSQTVANAVLQTLRADETTHTPHLLRIFLKPYMLGTHQVNNGAHQLLLREGSILNKAAGLVFDKGLSRLFAHTHRHFRWIEHPDFLAHKGLDTPTFENITSRIPMYRDGRRLWKIHHDYVRGFVELAYPRETDLRHDEDLLRFWQHVNTGGRHMDPCVCPMAWVDFVRENRWPETESTARCDGLLAFLGTIAHRDSFQESSRQRWCAQKDADKLRDLRRWHEARCAHEEPLCTRGLRYDEEYLRLQYNLPELSRENLIGFLTSFIFAVSAKHEFASDNVAYKVDPAFEGVRLAKGGETTQAEFGAYVIGMAITVLTTLRSPPLLNDWSHLFNDAEPLGLALRLRRLHHEYKYRLMALSNELFKEFEAVPANLRSLTFNPATHGSSIAV